MRIFFPRELAILPSRGPLQIHPLIKAKLKQLCVRTPWPWGGDGRGHRGFSWKLKTYCESILTDEFPIMPCLALLSPRLFFHSQRRRPCPLPTRRWSLKRNYDDNDSMTGRRGKWRGVRGWRLRRETDTGRARLRVWSNACDFIALYFNYSTMKVILRERLRLDSDQLNWMETWK